MNRGFALMRLVPTGWVVGLATLGPVGRRLPAPGTWGSLAGLGWYAVVFHSLPAPAALVALAVTAWLAMAVTNEAEVRLQQRDPGMVILDEFVAMPVCFWGLAPWIERWGGWPVVLAGFALFRLFDIWKPGPIGRLQKIPGGPGVVGDDLAAAGLTCLLLHAGVRVWEWFG